MATENLISVGDRQGKLRVKHVDQGDYLECYCTGCGRTVHVRKSYWLSGKVAAGNAHCAHVGQRRGCFTLVGFGFGRDEVVVRCDCGFAGDFVDGSIWDSAAPSRFKECPHGQRKGEFTFDSVCNDKIVYVEHDGGDLYAVTYDQWFDGDFSNVDIEFCGVEGWGADSLDEEFAEVFGSSPLFTV